MNTVGVNRKTALSFLSKISLSHDSNIDKSMHKEGDSNKSDSKRKNKQKRNDTSVALDLPPDPDLEESGIRIPRPPSSPNSPPKQIRKPLRTRRDKTATLFLSSISVPNEEDKEEGQELVSSPVSINNNASDSLNNKEAKEEYFIPILDRKNSSAASVNQNIVYSSSSSSDDDENTLVPRKDSYNDEDIALLGTSKRSSYLSDRSNMRDLATTISTNLEPIFAEDFYESRSKTKPNTDIEGFRIRNKTHSKSKSKKNRHDSYKYLLNSNSTLKPDAVTEYNPHTLDDPNLEIEIKSSGFRDLMDSLLIFTKTNDNQDLEDTFQETHPTVDQSLNLAHIRSIKQKILEIVQSLDLELSSAAIAYVFFEKLCLKGLINKENRKVKGAACLFLAIKVNEHKSKLNGIMDAFDRVFDLSDKDIRKAEFKTFAELEFSLYIPKDEFLPHLERIIKGTEYERIEQYVGYKIFYQ